MARRGKNPDAELAALREKRVGLATKRHEVDSATAAAQHVVDAIPDRRRAVLLAEARGETPPETVEQINAEHRQAHEAVGDGRERSEALRTVEKETEDEVDAVIDAHPGYFVERAEASSEEARQALVAATDAAQVALTSWRAARDAWGLVRLSRKRRGLDLTPEVPVNDLGTTVSELSKAQATPFPGGSRDAWERFREHEGLAKPAKVSNAEAIAQFGGEA